MWWSFLASTLPLALAATPAARWGHQAVYVDSLSAMYVVGGEVSSSGNEITNEVLILPLNQSSPSWSTGPDTDLPPHAFASMTLTGDGNSIVVVGGMTASCSNDSVSHTLDLSSNSAWTGVSPDNFVRRHGSGIAWIDNDSTNGEIMVVAGLADSYACADSTSAYVASDILSLPLSTTALVSSRSLPSSLTGADLAVSDFAMTATTNGTLYLVGGQDANGDLVALSSIGVWNSSSGWTSQAVSGDAPVGRLGATLVAHPTLDLLILHGGSVLNSSTGTTSPSALVSFINTTTWTWSTPSNLQPPASSSCSYHTSVMTPSGVMITAFGMSASGSLSSNVYFLDMRDPTGSTWSWKSVWSSSMLSSYTPSTTTTSSSPTSSDTSADDKKVIVSSVVPTVIILAILLPIAIYFIRRQVRLARKRRLARHFSFSSQEDNGDFSRPIEQFGASRRTRTLYPFGLDANEKEGNFWTDLAGTMSGLFSRTSDRSTDGYQGNGEVAVSGCEMAQVANIPSVHRLNQNSMNWEEIDFGLGRIDEERRDPHTSTEADHRDSFTAPGSPRNDSSALNMPIASTRAFPDPHEFEGENTSTTGTLVQISNSPRLGSPKHDGQAPLIPSLVISQSDPELNQSGLEFYPTMQPSPAIESPFADPPEAADWTVLEKALENRPAFRSISPTATLRSHSHAVTATPTTSLYSVAAPSTPQPPSTPPMLPPLNFTGSPMSLVTPRTSHRLSGIGSLGVAPRSVSQPLGLRQLTGPVRRTSDGHEFGAAMLPKMTSSSSASRRASNPNLSSLLYPNPTLGINRHSAMSRLRVVNATNDNESVESDEAM